MRQFISILFFFIIALPAMLSSWMFHSLAGAFISVPIYLVLLVSSYTTLSTLRESVQETFNNFRAAIAQGVNTINALEDLAVQYTQHEKNVHLPVAELQTNDSSYSESLQTLAVVTRLTVTFPKLRSDSHYRQLMSDLDRIRREIRQKLEIHNEAVRRHNSTLSSFPHFILGPFFTGWYSYVNDPEE